ncbi:alpha/beta hydrolase [Ferruginibacter albus]|uniref:alpha/beta hydrolase n=1 Tax=Ferruginibacter albus TaxID=2875540 RepID=UPI001CC44B90|nr:alpha/beta hydrolase [Ferruginibacter albus]UAY50926.1 alpha/beta hydrolase [Ferruginibacter albus]
MKILFHTIILLLMTTIASSQSVEEIALYKEVPNSIKTGIKERTIYVDSTRRIYDVTNPAITKYTPNNPNGMAIIICPGGGYQRLSIDNEGTHVAKFLNEFGITAFVLKYRLPNDTLMIDKTLGPLQDIQQAIRLVRENASQWNLNKNKIGVIGFSAGGHVASSAITHFNFMADASIKDTTSVRPDFAALIYPVISFNDSIMHKGSRDKLLGEHPSQEKNNFFSNELQVTKDCPPVFIVHAQNDKTVPVENSIRFYEACIKNNVPAEMHLYPKGGHGFGLHNTTTTDIWQERLINWLHSL